MKSISLFRISLTLICLSLCIPLTAQTKDFREPGFKGSVGVSSQVSLNAFHIWEIGVDLSLGKMLNQNHYVGGEISLRSLVKMTFGAYETRLSVHYMAYCLDRDSTPVWGVKAGTGILSPGLTQFEFYSIFLEPHAGWSWRLPSGNGLTLSAGLDLNCSLLRGPGIFVSPKISIAFEF